MTGTHARPSQLHKMGGRIVAVKAGQRQAALARLLGGRGRGAGRAQIDRFLQYTEHRGIDLDTMWARLNDDETVAGTVLIVPNPGRTAMVFASAPAHRQDAEPLGELIAHAAKNLGDLEVDLAQALLDPAEQIARAAFRAGGFHDLAHLSYLERSLPRRSAAKPPVLPPGITLRAYAPELDEEILSHILDASYEETLDCPGLRGLRRTTDVIAGHQEVGQFDPGLWTLLFDDAHPVGALLLNIAPDERTAELVYVGLAPEARGRGFGTMLLEHGLHQLASSSASMITLAVDEANTPAVALYERFGFRRAARRMALICSVNNIAQG